MICPDLAQSYPDLSSIYPDLAPTYAFVEIPGVVLGEKKKMLKTDDVRTIANE